MYVDSAIFRFTPTGTDLADWYSLTVKNAFGWVNEGWGGHITVCFAPLLCLHRSLRAYTHLQGPTLIYVTPLLNTTAARTSMQPVIDFVTARNGTAIVEELTWFEFFEKYVLIAEAVRRLLYPYLATFLLLSSEDVADCIRIFPYLPHDNRWLAMNTQEARASCPAASS